MRWALSSRPAWSVAMCTRMGLLLLSASGGFSSGRGDAVGYGRDQRPAYRGGSPTRRDVSGGTILPGPVIQQSLHTGVPAGPVRPMASAPPSSLSVPDRPEATCPL
ncbi:hypothetical protein ACFFX0_02140 [Citricoccus parietis]|uniref:Secreted protein n=1 Tax=Citricoccus parietis TaxID=592307 RepID=A0ABV5FTP5_9MICC